MRTLERAHPVCCFAYILCELCMTFLTRNPLLLAISLVGAAALLSACGKPRSIAAMLLLVLVCAISNPLFSHNGSTVLFFISHLPITAESVAYGAAFGVMLAAAVGWSISSVRFITSDKYIWLFGRALPLCGLVLSCALRLVPLFIRRARDFAASQRAVSLRDSLKAFSAAVGYSAEEAMMSADSMRARGYGTARRTSYSLYRMGAREYTALFAVLFFGGSSLVLTAAGFGRYDFYPVLSALPCGAADVALYIMFAVFSALPGFTAAAEALRRRKISST